MAQKRLTVYFSKTSSSGTTQQAQCLIQKHRTLWNVLYVQKLIVIVTVIQALRVALNPLQTRSQKAMTQHHHPLRYLKWYLEAARVKLRLDITLVSVEIME